MHRYYTQKLSAEMLRQCYEVAPPRAKQYLEAEIEFVRERIKPSDLVIELGCGYGRVLEKLFGKAKILFGIDTSLAFLQLARETFSNSPWCHLFNMDALELGFRNGQFDVVICIQNGISAFKVDQRKLVREALRVTRSGGRVVFSSYSEHFWDDRLEWFQVQSEHGLVGEIDYDLTGNGVIICKDGFKATTVGPDDFISLTSNLGIVPKITEVDGSSIFCEIDV
jgi:SAM-dependent methyltransferase